MGQVFLADDPRLNRKVALKSLSERWANEPSARRRLIREARAAAALNHPNIAAVYDVVESADSAYIVMEYVPGESLARRLLDGPLRVPEALSVGVQLCDALSAAHAQGILHRDLKPANLVLTPAGRLKVLDFGLAKSMLVDSAASSDSLGSGPSGQGVHLVGTPAYIPPERYEGAIPNEREDVYSAGVVLYELLAGRRAFQARDFAAVAAAVVQGEFLPLRVVAPLLSGAVARVVERSMSRKPGGRHGSAAALRADLERLRAGEFQETGTGPGARRLAGRGFAARWTTAAAAVTLSVAGLAAGYEAWSRTRGSPARVVPVVLVLPLVNATGNPTDEALGTGVADVLVSALSRVSGINVLSLAAGQECARGRRDLACAVGKLGADYVLDGSVQRQVDRIRVTLSLVRAPSRLVSWSESYDGALEDLFGFQQTVADGVAGALRLRVSHAATSEERPFAIGERAFSDYAEALRLLERRDEPQSIDRAITLLAGVVAAEPRFALAQAGLGRAHWIQYEETKEIEHAGRAEAALAVALHLDPNLPVVLVVQASVLKTKGQFPAAEAAARRALTLQPENDEAHALLGGILSNQGRKDEGRAELMRAIELRPNYWLHHQALALADYSNGALDSAAAGFRRVVALRPESAWGYVNLGSALYGLGDRAGARENFEKAVALQPDADAFSNLGFLAYEEKRFADAVEAFRKATELLPRDAGLRRNLGDALARLKRPAEARAAYLEALELQRAEVRVRLDDASQLARLALYEAKTGHLQAAQKRATAARALAPASAEVAYFAGIVSALAGREQDSLEAIRRAVELGYSREVVRVDDDLEQLRKRPEFAALLDVP